MTNNQPPSHPIQSSSSADDKDVPLQIHLRLYIAGTAPNSLRATSNLTKICETHLVHYEYRVEIVDVWAEPARARADGIIATPTLLRLLPEPQVIMIGDLGNVDIVLLTLGLEKLL